MVMCDGNVSPDRIMGARLIRDKIRDEISLHHLRQQLRGVSRQTDRDSLTLPLCGLSQPDRLVERINRSVEIACLKAALNSFGVDLDTDAHSSRQFDRKRLGAAHTAETR